jgi:hypothetical protein
MWACGCGRCIGGIALNPSFPSFYNTRKTTSRPTALQKGLSERPSIERCYQRPTPTPANQGARPVSARSARPPRDKQVRRRRGWGMGTRSCKNWRCRPGGRCATLTQQVCQQVEGKEKWRVVAIGIGVVVRADGTVGQHARWSACWRGSRGAGDRRGEGVTAACPGDRHRQAK